MIPMKILKNFNQNKEHKISFFCDYVITYMFINKKPNPVVTELFIRGGKLNITLSITFNHSLDIDFEDVMNLYENLLQNLIYF